MSDKPRLPPTGAYDVGYAKPPVKTRFKKGVSGNPDGRPKGSKNKMPASYDRIKNILKSEAYREVEIQEKSGPISMPVVQAAMRSLALKAAKGHIEAQKLLLTSLAAVEAEDKREALATFDKASAYKKQQTAIIAQYRARGEEPPRILPHPDSIELDLETGDVYFHGPVSEADLQTWVNVHGMRDAMADEVAYYKELLRLLKKRDPDTLQREEISSEAALEEYIAYIKEQIAENHYIYMFACYNIMRKWHLSGREVAGDFMLGKILDQHIANGTAPEDPKPDRMTNFDWEDAYKKLNSL